jgi:3'(2'), 5'-bisphosphate nucleotidase
MKGIPIDLTRLTLLGEIAAVAGSRADEELARELATVAGSMLLTFRESAHGTGLTVDELRAQGDARAQRLLSKALLQHRPGDAVLSEEAPDDLARLSADRVWIIDPLDGTREFAEGRSDWAVHVALHSHGRLTAGAVAVPALGYVTGRKSGLWVRKPGRQLRIAVSRSRPPRLAEAVAGRLGAKLEPMGSAGYKTCAVISGEVDAYLHSGGQFEWDSAAPVFAARQAGLHTSRVDGSELRYNQKSPSLPDLLICHPDIRDILLVAIADVLKDPSAKGHLDQRATEQHASERHASERRPSRQSRYGDAGDRRG